MTQSIAAADENRRLAALRALDILDTPAEQAFDALAALAARLLDCPIGLISLLDEHRLWVKASVGVDVDQAPRHHTFCDHTVRADDAMIVRDATQDARFRDLGFVSDGGIRFYAGAPLHAPHPETGESYRVGAICALDRACHEPDPAQRAALAHLGTLAEALLAARTRSREAMAAARAIEAQAAALRRSDTIFRQTERIAAIGSWRYDIAAATLDWSDGVARIHELPAGTVPSLAGALDFYPGEERAKVAAIFERTARTGVPFGFETDFITALGNRRRVRSMGEAELVEGAPVAVTGVFQDVTARYRLEQELRRSADADGLTGIANRATFDRLLEQAMARAGRRRAPLTLVLIDLDRFKQLNDGHGHAAGDDVLRATAARLSEPWLAGSGAARLGGDEFGLIVTDRTLCADGEQLAARLLAELHRPVESVHGTLPSAATIGFATFDPHSHADVRAFLHSADCALYEAKRAGRGIARRFVAEGRRSGDRPAMRAA